MAGSAFSLWLRSGDERPTIGHVTAIASSLRRSHLYNGFLKEFSDLSQARVMKDTWCRRAFQFNGFKFLHSSNEAYSSKFEAGKCYFYGEEGIKEDFGNEGVSNPKSSKTNPSNKIKIPITTTLIAVNASTYIADTATFDKLSAWGAKNNYWIRNGQWWRLVTCAFLHTSALHCLANSYSLYNVGSATEPICGPKRFLSVYFASAIAGSGFSYWFSKSPSVGASGAIFGLFGSYAVFVMRHREYMDGGGKKALQSIIHVLALNMALGLLVKRIDHWGHLGGFLGGVAASWLLGPVLTANTLNGEKVVFDRPPISYLFNRNSKGTPYTVPGMFKS